jgi:hypothetical protein
MRLERRQRDDFIELVVNEGHRDLNFVDGVIAREIDGSLGVMEVECFKGIVRPISRILEVKLGADMLKQNSHEFDSERH